MSNIITRTLAGAVFIVLIISSLFVGRIATGIVLGAFMLIGVYEFYKFFTNSERLKPKKIVSLVGAFVLYVSLIFSTYYPVSFNFHWVLIPILFLPFLAIVYSKSKDPLADLAMTIFPWIYLAYPFFLMFAIYDLGPAESPWIYLLGLFLLVWTNDTFAYLSGRQFGKHKLFERISPKKTWEGTIGGFVFTVIMALFYGYYTEESLFFWALAAAIISPASVLGDLIESRFKRIVNVKDSGKIMPGHGGILDRFDAIIYAAPFFYLLLILYQLWVG